MHRIPILPILTALIALPLMAQTSVIRPSGTAPATETASFPLQNGGRLNVSNVNGDIKVTAWDKEEVALTARFKPDSDQQHARIEIESKPRALELVVKHPDNKKYRRGRSASCEMELKVPRHIICDMNNVNGSIFLKAIIGEHKSRTVNGSIVLENTDGRTNATTVNGAVVLESVNGQILTSTVNGTIKGSVRNVEDNLDISTTNGNIDIKLLNPNGTIKISTFRGSAKLLTPGAKNIEAGKKSVKAQFADGTAIMTFKSFNGSVVVR